MGMYAVALVGLDGAGKTTQARLLTERLRDAGYEATYVHPSNDLISLVPGGESIKQRIVGWFDRPTLVSRATRRLCMVLFGYWFALISLALARYRYRNRIVVFDRYRHQFLYDCYGPLAPWLIRTLPVPQQTVWLTADLDTLIGRMSDRDRDTPRSYYRSAHRFHERLAETHGWARVKTDQPIDNIESELFYTITRPEAHAALSPTGRRKSDTQTETTG
jgi:thymidylate kinase